MQLQITSNPCSQSLWCITAPEVADILQTLDSPPVASTSMASTFKLVNGPPNSLGRQQITAELLVRFVAKTWYGVPGKPEGGVVKGSESLGGLKPRG